MTQYVDSVTYLGTINRYSDGTSPSLAWQYAVKPEWIHGLLDLWRRNYVLPIYLEKATDRIAQDIHSASIRRQTLYQITHDFVPLSLGEQLQRTLSPNIWAVYSKLYDAQTLAPAYLVNIVASNAIVNAVNGLVHRHYVLGDTVNLRDVRPFLVSRFGDRNTIRAGANSALRTFAYFGALALPKQSGEYQFRQRLSIDGAVFPLLIWSWWRLHNERIIRIEDLNDDPLMALVDCGSCESCWQRYDGLLWTLERQNGAACAMLRPTDSKSFLRIMLNLLASHPRWPAVSKHFVESKDSEAD